MLYNYMMQQKADYVSQSIISNYFNFFESVSQVQLSLSTQDLKRHDIESLVHREHLINYSKSKCIRVKHCIRNARMVEYQVCVSVFKIQITMINLLANAEPILQNSKIYLGKGGFGEVRIQNTVSQKFAVKRQYFKSDPQRACKEEIQCIIQQVAIHKICSLCHIGPAISKSIGFDVICFSNCIEFHLQICQSISQVINTGNLNQKYTKYVSDLKQNLRSLHSLKLVHKDIKFGNILYSRTYQKFVLTDFGLTHAVAEEIGQKSETFVEGTVKYFGNEMSQLHKQGFFKGMVDLYENDRQGLEKCVSLRNLLEYCQNNQQIERSYLEIQEYSAYSYQQQIYNIQSAKSQKCSLQDIQIPETRQKVSLVKLDRAQQTSIKTVFDRKQYEIPDLLSGSNRSFKIQNGINITPTYYEFIKLIYHSLTVGSDMSPHFNLFKFLNAHQFIEILQIIDQCMEFDKIKSVYQYLSQSNMKILSNNSINRLLNSLKLQSENILSVKIADFQQTQLSLYIRVYGYSSQLLRIAEQTKNISSEAFFRLKEKADHTKISQLHFYHSDKFKIRAALEYQLQHETDCHQAFQKYLILFKLGDTVASKLQILQKFKAIQYHENQASVVLFQILESEINLELTKSNPKDYAFKILNLCSNPLFDCETKAFFLYQLLVLLFKYNFLELIYELTDPSITLFEKFNIKNFNPLISNLYQLYAQVSLRHQNPNAALTLATYALNISQQFYGDNCQTARKLQQLASIYLKLGDSQSAMRNELKAIRILNKNSAYIINCSYYNIAFISNEQNKPQTAINYLTQMLKAENPSENCTNYICLLILLSSAHLNNNFIDKALEYTQQAQLMLKFAEDKVSKALILHQKSVIAFRKGNFLNSLNLELEAYQIITAREINLEQQFAINYQLAEIYIQINKVQQSKQYNSNSFNICIRLYGKNHPKTGLVLIQQARIQLELSHLQQSLRLLNTSLIISEDSKDIQLKSMCYAQFSSIYLFLEQYNLSEQYNQLCYQIQKDKLKRLYQWSQICFARRQLSQALKSGLQCLAESKHNYQSYLIHLHLAKINLQMRNFLAAEQSLQQCQSCANISKDQINFLRSQLHFEQQNYDVAMQYVNRIDETSIDHIFRVQTLILKSKILECLEYYHQSCLQAKSAINLAKGLSQYCRVRVVSDAQHQLVCCYLKLQNYQQALKLQTQCETMLKQKYGQQSRSLQKVYYCMAFIYFTLRQYKQALKYLSQSIKLCQIYKFQDPWNFKLLSMVYDNTNKLRQALFYSKKSILTYCKLYGRMNFKIALAFHQHSFVLNLINNNRKAITYSRKSLDILVKNGRDRYIALYNLACILKQMHAFQNANLIFEELLEFADPKTRNFVAHKLDYSYQPIYSLNLNLYQKLKQEIHILSKTKRIQRLTFLKRKIYYHNPNGSRSIVNLLQIIYLLESLKQSTLTYKRYLSQIKNLASSAEFLFLIDSILS